MIHTLITIKVVIFKGCIFHELALIFNFTNLISRMATVGHIFLIQY